MVNLPEQLQDVLDGRRPPPPILSLLGARLTETDDDRAVVVLEVAERHANFMGTLHGGVLCDIADAAMGMAYVTGLQEGESFATVELKINYLRPVWTGTLTADGRVVRRGREVGYAECGVRDEEGSLVAKASSTCMTLRGEKARGR